MNWPRFPGILGVSVHNRKYFHSMEEVEVAGADPVRVFKSSRDAGLVKILLAASIFQ